MRPVILTFLLWLSLQVAAQNFSIRTLPTQQQLPVARVHCLLQDSEGYIWYGTVGGLCRDNGYQVDIFRPSDTKSRKNAGWIHCLMEDKAGNIVFGTNDGAFYINKADYSIHRITFKGINLADSMVTAIYTDSKGMIWMGVAGHILLADNNYHIKKVYQCRLNGKDATPASFYEDSHSAFYTTLWEKGILRLDKNRQQFTPMGWPQESIPIHMIEDTQNHCFWVCARGAGIVKMRIAGGYKCELEAQPATTATKGQSILLYMLRDSRRDIFWATTTDDLYAYRIDTQGKLQNLDLSHVLRPGKKILDGLMEDNSGRIYVAGWAPHTFIISSEQTEIVRRTIEPIRKLTGFPVLADRTVTDGGYIWIWQGRTGLALYNKQTEQLLFSPWKVENTITRCGDITNPQRENGIWAFSGSQVMRLWHENGKINREDIVTLPAGETVAYVCDDQQQSLWIASDKHLYHLSLLGRRLRTIASLPDKTLQMHTDKQANAYLALGAAGLYKVSSKGKAVLLSKDIDESFLSVRVSTDGTVWASTFEGSVYHYLPAKNTLLKEKEMGNEEGHAIKSITVDGMGHVWTLTDHQVREIVPGTHAFRQILNTSPSVDVSYFYTLELIDQDVVSIDGAGALLEVPSSAELNVQTSVQPRLASVVLDDNTMFPGKGVYVLRLKPDENTAELRLTTLDYSHASEIRYAYMLKGEDREWTYLSQGSNVILLRKLSKGSHKLLVKATNKYGCWGDACELLTIDRAPHWWETWWAYLLYIVVVIAVAIGLWQLQRRIHLLRRLIIRRQQVRLNEIEMKREDISKLQRDDEFLQRAIAKTEEYLSDPGYNVEALSADMCMSRITFYRRMQEQTGLSPTEFIRDIRLKKAASLLMQHPDATISDVARKVGFATPTYFTRCFKEKFGVLPKDYNKKEE